MNRERVLQTPTCSVSGGEKILDTAGGANALCNEIEQALAAGGHAGAATVTILARRTHLSATVRLADGRTLPDLGLAVSDAPVSRNAIKRFALQIAEAVRSAKA